MQRLEQRIAALEKVQNPGEGVTVLIDHLTDKECRDDLYSLSAGDGETWTRHPGESADDLESRAIREVKRNAQGFAALIMAGRDASD